MSLQAMYRAMTGVVVACAPLFTGDKYIVFDSYPQPATAGIEMDADGAIEGFKGSGNIGDIGRWDGGCGTLDRADYDFRVDVLTGSLSGNCDPSGTWIPGAGGLPRFCVHVPVPIGLQRMTGTLRVRPAGGGSDIDTALIDLEGDLT